MNKTENNVSDQERLKILGEIKWPLDFPGHGGNNLKWSFEHDPVFVKMATEVWDSATKTYGYFKEYCDLRIRLDKETK